MDCLRSLSEGPFAGAVIAFSLGSLFISLSSLAASRQIVANKQDDVIMTRLITYPHSNRRAFVSIKAAITLLLINLSVNACAGTMQSNIKKDENVIFFRTDAAYVPDTNQWEIPIHGWVYEDERSWFRKNAFSRVMQRKYGLTVDDDSSVFFNRRAGLLIADNERNKKIVIQLGGQQFVMPPSAANGHFKGQVRLSQEELDALTNDDIVRFSAVLPARDRRELNGEFRLVEPVGLSVISDIDDTVKVTGVTVKKDLMDNTFYRDFAAVPDMAELYRKWSRNGMDIHFISSSPWQLYPELLDFAEVHNFPWASFYLKSIRFKDSSILNLFKEGLVTKPVQISALIERFPDRRFILVGDSGEQDPEAYTLMMERYPERIEVIYIRNVTDAAIDDTRFSPLTARLPEGSMFLFDDPMEIDLLERQRR